jgi:hypothetical protein
MVDKLSKLLPVISQESHLPPRQYHQFHHSFWQIKHLHHIQETQQPTQMVCILRPDNMITKMTAFNNILYM